MTNLKKYLMKTHVSHGEVMLQEDPASMEVTIEEFSYDKREFDLLVEMLDDDPAVRELLSAIIQRKDIYVMALVDELKKRSDQIMKTRIKEIVSKI